MGCGVWLIVALGTWINGRVAKVMVESLLVFRRVGYVNDVVSQSFHGGAAARSLSSENPRLQIL